ncbi:MAG: hypothetical protein SFY32_05640 [Bacteroidota bacterium]|nr:hypothetical protein [Bacteroidota bacterium]
MKKTIITISILLSGILSFAQSSKSNTSPIFEIAVRSVKEGKNEDFEKARKAFIEKLTKIKGVSNDREFQSFYALPTPDKTPVFIGMTQYESNATLGSVQSNKDLMNSFMNFAQTMDLKAYVFIQPTEGGDFNLSTLAKKQGQILEIAVRRVKSGQEADFDKMRKAFVAKLGKEDGVIQSWEFKVVGGNATERLTVGMTVYENQEKFQKIGQATQTWAESAFFGTFEPVALQYAFSVK